MSDMDINKMSFKQLKNEVQLLRDELAIFKRKYEDAIYNLDNDNFGKSIIVEKNNMKAQITVTAEKIQTKVSKTDLAGELEKYSTITQTAEKIELAVKAIENSTDKKLEKYSTITQTAEMIQTKVSEVESDVKECYSMITQTAEMIQTKVSKTDLDAKLKEYSTITQTAQQIQTVVSKSADLSKAIIIPSLEYATNKEKIYVVQESDDDGNVLSETYYYFNDITRQWEILSGDSIYTVFNQTAEGFSLKGNVLIDGNTVITKNLTLSGIVTWDMENSPVKSQYSANKNSWHDTYTLGDMYMRMTFDGGKTWGNAVKVVGTDGKNGSDGKDGANGVVDYSQVNAILKSAYGIESTTLSQSSISSPTIYTATMYSPEIYGEELVLVTQNESNKNIYNNLYLTPTSMYLKNAYGGIEATKFYIDLGTDTANSSIKMRLGAGVNSAGAQALNIEKYTDEIRIGTYISSSGTVLSNFAGMIITPSTGKITFTGEMQAVAVFG